MDQDEAYLWKQRAQVGADRIKTLERLLDRAYPWLHCPYTPQGSVELWAQFQALMREIEHAIAHLKEEEDPPVALPCASCDGDGCPNCAMTAILRENR
jgi:hypothetical protein